MNDAQERNKFDNIPMCCLDYKDNSFIGVDINWIILVFFD